ncbi:MAG TPA: anhydro-N-acetylmuramic acid kinase [Gammaproteobacteria bacterium]|nr:anhydro-N-acetylmuramic acid kinase [Gammaproteobacteria bacterium]
MEGSREDLYIGLMSGTSADAVDAVLVDLAPSVPRLLASLAHPLPGWIREAVAAIGSAADGGGLVAAARLDSRLGGLFADAVDALLEQCQLPPGSVRAVGSHGQTVRHDPDGDPPYTVQLGDPNVIAARTGITTVADFRRRDIADGGQGAPLVPAFHQALLRVPGRDRAVLNIGGIANLTLLPARGDARGFDTGPGNCLLDAWAREHGRGTHDAGGAWAASGTPRPDLLERLLGEPYFARTGPRSTGRELFNTDWLRSRGGGALAGEPADVQATLCLLTARSVARALREAAPETEELLVCGGGVHNDELIRALAAELPGTSVRPTTAAGLDPDWIEAMAFAWLARRTLHGEPGNLPAVTGARAPAVLGAIYAASLGP